MALIVDIKKRLGRFRLDVSFEADTGVLGILGASGCGKSLTLKCIAGLEKPDSGHIELNGRVLFDSSKRIDLNPQQRHVGYLFQQYALFPNMTVAQNIAAGAHALPKAQRAAAVAEKIKSFQLQGLEKKYPPQLSGGQQQRTALARILISRPEALLLDEPFSALDDYLKWQVELELSDTLQDFPGTTLFVSHSRDEVFRLCQNVCVLADGKSEPIQSAERLFRGPETLSACLLSGCKNYTRIQKLDKTHALALDWGVTIQGADIPDGCTFAGVRSHFIRPGDGPNPIHCTVERVIREMFSTVVMVRTPGGDTTFSRLRLEMPPEQWQALGQPGELTVSIAPQDIMYLREN